MIIKRFQFEGFQMFQLGSCLQTCLQVPSVASLSLTWEAAGSSDP